MVIDTVPQLCGEGFLIAGDSAMLFNALHREGSNLAMTSGRLAAETILEAMEHNDFSSMGLQGYVKRMEESYVLKDLKKYRRFPSFFWKPTKNFSPVFPGQQRIAVRQMLMVNGVPKKAKQREVWKAIRGKCSRSAYCALHGTHGEAFDDRQS